MERVERSGGGRVSTYLKNTVVDAAGIRRAREVAADHPVVDLGERFVTVDMLAVGAGVLEVTAPIFSRGFQSVDERINESRYGDKAWIGYPASILAEFAVTLGSIGIASNHSSTMRDAVIAFAMLKASEIGLTTVGRDIFNAACVKATKRLLNE